MSAIIPATIDVECYYNYFLVKLKDLPTGQYHEFHLLEGHPLDILGLKMAIAVRECYGFNLDGYDKLMIALALTGADNALLKAASDNIIQSRMRPYQFYLHYQIPEPRFNFVDLQEVAPGVRISLKMYAGRMHSKRMQDLPIDPQSILVIEQMRHIADYCGNDLDVTEDMAMQLKKRVDLRRKLGERYGLDLRSKSDAQIAEAVIARQLGRQPKVWRAPPNHTFYFDMPEWVQFSTHYMYELREMIRATPFTATDTRYGMGVKDGVNIPNSLAGLDIYLGKSIYRMGIGGLHSRESQRAIIAAPGWCLSEHDVRSYYPSLLINAGRYPPSIGPEFFSIYSSFYWERLGSDDKTTKDTLKIVLNGAYGKLGSKYSFLYAPELLIQTTISGQLALLMLIERLECAEISVVSANTDGIVVYCPVDRISDRDAIIRQWELDTNLAMEDGEFIALFNKSVNDYVAVYKDGKIKRKGTTFALPGLEENKHPDREICADAAVAYLTKGVPVSDTVRNCQDIRKFVRIRRAAHGAVWNRTGEYLGKAIRWYWGTDMSSKIICAKSARPGGDSINVCDGNLIASSSGAVPCLELPDTLPRDLNYDYYIQEARNIINDVGVWAGNA